MVGGRREVSHPSYLFVSFVCALFYQAPCRNGRYTEVRFRVHHLALEPCNLPQRRRRVGPKGRRSCICKSSHSARNQAYRGGRGPGNTCGQRLQGSAWSPVSIPSAGRFSAGLCGRATFCPNGPEPRRGPSEQPFVASLDCRAQFLTLGVRGVCLVERCCRLPRSRGLDGGRTT